MPGQPRVKKRKKEKRINLPSLVVRPLRLFGSLRVLENSQHEHLLSSLGDVVIEFSFSFSRHVGRVYARAGVGSIISHCLV